MRKPIFFTSDWHIGHHNSLKFDNRPFDDMDDMCIKLVKYFNAQVPENAVTYFLGDMGFGKGGFLQKVIPQLNGTLIAVIGNHDPTPTFMYNIGFDAVLHGAVLYLHNERVTISHCPLLDTYREDTSLMKNSDSQWHGNNRPKHRRLSFTNDGQFHVHGHIHSPNKDRSKKILGRQFDVGLPANNYRPVHINEIDSWIMKTLNSESEIK